MKIVHVVTTDFGGAFKAVQRIQESIKFCGVQSNILVRSRFFESDTIEVMDTPFKQLFSKVRNFLNLLLSHGEVVTDMFGADVSRYPQVQKADVIILHWANSFISCSSVRKLAKLQKPLIWVMHDMWAFTGGCHYDAYCGRYEQGCGQCPYLAGKWNKDITYWNLKGKRALFDSVEISFVAISKWEEKCAQGSMALKGKKITCISNPLDLDVFHPLINREELRKKHGFMDKKVILFGADKALENPVKGFRYLIEALRLLNEEEYVAVCFGKAPEKQKIVLNNMKILYLGSVMDEKVLAEWYNIADVFVAPSLQESFGYTVCEALACGTPVTAFAVGGILDQVIHKENGYLANLYDKKELANGILYCIENRERLGVAARRHVTCYNGYDVVGRQYYELCERKLREYYESRSNAGRAGKPDV